MNKKRFSLALVSLLCATGLLAGCSSSDEGGEKEVASMKLVGIPTAYQLDETINWSALKVTVTYKDNNKDTFTGSQLQYDITSEVAETTKLVVYTAGLHAQTTLTEGEYNIEAAFSSNLTKKYSLGRIVVGKITDDKYTLDSFEVPQFVEEFRQTQAASAADPSKESSFKVSNDMFTVGTKNLFRFVPRASFELKGSTGGHSKRYTNYEKVLTLKEIKSDSSKVDADVDDYSYPADKSGVQFNESAAGKKFELTVSPADSGFAQDSNGHAAIISFSFQVKSGLNVYDAKQLGVLNLSSRTMVQNGTVNQKYISHIGRTTNAPEEGHKKHYYNSCNGNGASDVFWNSTDPDHPEVGNYSYVDYAGLWKDWLLEEEVFTEEEIAKYTDIKGVFFQNKITLNKEDIPSDYFITAQESGNLDEYGDMEYLRDGAEIYVPIIEAATGIEDRSKDVEINGNYFMLDNKLPTCNSNWGDALNKTFHTYGKNTSSIMGTYDPGHAALIRFCGIDPEKSDLYYYYQNDYLKGAKGIVKNINTMGVIEGHTGDNVLSVTALIFAKNSYCCAEYTNNIIKQYQIGLFPDHMYEGPRQMTMGDQTVKYNTLIDGCKVYDCSNCAICNYNNKGTVVKRSAFARFGGSAILNAGNIEEKTKNDPKYWPYALNLYQAGEYTGDPYGESSPYESLISSKNYIDEESSQSFGNYVVGTEAYFTAVGIATVMPEVFQSILPGYSKLFEKIGYTFHFEQDNKTVYNIIALNLDGHDYVMSPNHYWYGDTYLYADNADRILDAGCKNTDPEGAFAKYSTIRTILESVDKDSPAVFYTEHGDVFTSFWDPSAEPGESDVFITADSAINALMSTGYPVPFSFGEGKEVELVSVMLPSGNTTINAVFELRPLAA